MTFDARAFRTALGSFPTGVAVVTTTESAERHLGITVNSFTSVSLDPPLVLWCMDKKSDRYHAFTNAKCYTVSILGTEHQDVSARLADSLAVFECEAEAMHDAGDHAILIGRVVRFARHEDGAPLVFFRGKYGALATASRG
jgi:flavin reductase (DIM6/NTAB) family NADH-FMN oxidoreductase RutF